MPVTPAENRRKGRADLDVQQTPYNATVSPQEYCSCICQGRMRIVLFLILTRHDDPKGENLTVPRETELTVS